MVNQTSTAAAASTAPNAPPSHPQQTTMTLPQAASAQTAVPPSSSSSTQHQQHQQHAQQHHQGSQASDHVHVRFRVDISPQSSAKDRQDKIEQLSRLLHSLRDIARGRPVIDWDGLVVDETTKAPSETAASIAQQLHRYPAQLQTSIVAVASRISTPGRLAIVAHLEEPFRSKVRDEVLQAVLKGLTTCGNAPMPECSEMMVEMIRLDLVLIKGVATTLDTLLRDRNTRRAAMAVIGRLAERYATAGNKAKDEGLLHAVNHVKQTLYAAAADDPDSAFDYDVNAIQRFMGWRVPTQSSSTSTAAQQTASPSLLHVRTVQTPHKNITSTTYFASRDELVTAGGTADRTTIAVWGAPTYGEAASASFQLPAHTMPVMMDASVKGNLLAVGCVSFAKAGSPQSCVQAYLCSDSGAWTIGEAIRRPERTVITTVKCLAMKGSVVCTTETVLGSGGSGGSDAQQHRVVFFNASGSETRTIGKAHSDCITTVAVSPDSDHMLFTGSRDATVRLWDIRVGGSHGGGNAASSPSTTLEGHADAITSISPIRDVVMTASIDGTVKLWDLRRTRTELATKKFPSSVLKTVCTSNLTAAVCTLQGLYLLSLMPLQTEDVVSSVCYTDIRTNVDGNVLFASSKNVVDVYAVHGGK